MVAIRTITTLNASFTQAQLRDAIITAFTNAGFSATFDNYTSGTDLILVYEFVVDGSKTFGKTYLRVRITNALIVFQQVLSSWNTGTKAGTNGSTEVNYGTLVSTTNVIFNAFNGSNEYRLVILTQGSLIMPLGMVSPIIRRESWSLDSWNWGYIFTTAAMVALRSSTLNPYSSTDNEIALAGNTRLAFANNQDNERDLIGGLILLNNSNQGFAAKTSEDLSLVSANGSTRYDTVFKSGTSEQYLIVATGNGGIAIRVV